MISYIRIGPPAWAAVADERGKMKTRMERIEQSIAEYLMQLDSDTNQNILAAGNVLNPPPAQT